MDDQLLSEQMNAAVTLEFMVLFLLGISCGMFIMAIGHKLTQFHILGFLNEAELRRYWWSH